MSLLKALSLLVVFTASLALAAIVPNPGAMAPGSSAPVENIENVEDHTLKAVPLSHHTAPANDSFASLGWLPPRLLLSQYHPRAIPRPPSRS